MHPPEMSAHYRWAIFCRVVDNLGDIGVCWRLARMLACFHGQQVQLWVDDLEAFFRLCPQARQPAVRLTHEGVEVCLWGEPWLPTACAEIVIEAFSCDPPASYVQTMAAHQPSPVWINLEYLSAEDWVAGVHRMRSPHPRLPLIKHFFCPGFTPATGGLPREPDLLARRDAYGASASARTAFLETLGVGAAVPGALTISLFAYAHPDLGEMLRCWEQGDRPVQLLVPQGRMLEPIARHLGAGRLDTGARVQRQALTVVALPFVPQRDYDRLLWSCDVNFVRGEDSFVRAQWAARPMVWQIYPQQEQAHMLKLEAFLQRYTQALDDATREAVVRFWYAWNGQGSLTAHWPAYAAALPELGRHARGWCAELAQMEDLATSLVSFCKAIVKSRVF